jgi:phenylacetate-CoA ligase
MSVTAPARMAWSVMRAARMNREALRRLHDQKLRRVVSHAWDNVPYYRRLFDGAGIGPDSIRSVDDLVRLPVTTRKDLLEAGEDAFSRSYPRRELVSHRTTGSTGEPMTMYFDRHFERVRSLAFLRALLAAGYRPGQRLLMMKAGRAERSPWWTRWDNVSFDEAPESIARRLEETRTAMLYGWVTPIREVATYVRDAGIRLPGLRAIVTTAEALDEPTRALLAEAFEAEVFNFYGLTEMGTVAWECSRHDGLHLSEDIVFAETSPGATDDDDQAMIMTNLELTAMPLIRYQTGDLAISLDTRACPCGRGFHRIRQVSGRMVDCLRLPNGRMLSPYRVTLALETVPRLSRYQVVQERPDRLVMRYEGAETCRDAARQALAELVGSDVQIEIRREDSIRPEPGRKFRVVASRIEDR